MTSTSLDPTIVPAGLVVDRHEIGPDGVIVHAHGGACASICPACGTASSSVQVEPATSVGAPRPNRRSGSLSLTPAIRSTTLS